MSIVGKAITMGSNSGSAQLDALLNNTITSVESDVTTLQAYKFNGCASLASVKFPKCTTVHGEGQFFGCSSLKRIGSDAFPLVTNWTGNSTIKISGIECLVLPALVTHSGSYCFSSFNKLAIADFRSITILNNFCLSDNPLLETLILGRSSIVTLGNINVFSNTPFKSGGTGGTIYIPKALYDRLGDGSPLDYKAATNWSTIDGYGTITWAKIEGSQYENYYADGTPIPTV